MLNTIDEILADMREGKMAVLMDDEDRENEGDLIMAAECVRAEDVNFMARYRPRAHLPHAHAGALPPAAAAAHGQRHRQLRIAPISRCRSRLPKA